MIPSCTAVLRASLQIPLFVKVRSAAIFAKGRLANPIFLLQAILVLSLFIKPAPSAKAEIAFIAGGEEDGGTSTEDVVVLLTGPQGSCTGTLVTPMAVLTAKHCINGATNCQTDKPGIGSPITISVGLNRSAPVRQYTSSGVTPTKTWDGGPLDCHDYGKDLAVVFLDPPGTVIPGSKPGPAFDYAYIIHPTLTSPCPVTGCENDTGGRYSPTIGMAGWAPGDAPKYRQVAYVNTLAHFEGAGGNYWVHVRDNVHVDPGDSGGPLFTNRQDTKGHWYRDVIGVLSGHDDTTDHWTDITRGVPADWVRNALADQIPRGPKWLQMHPGLRWYGDVNYTGECSGPGNLATPLDQDCDHIFDSEDNCVYVFNPDQRDTADSGRGDACPPSPPTTPGPTPDCATSVSCNGVIGGPPTITLQCKQTVEFWLQFVGGSRQFLGIDVSYTGSATDYDEHLLACTLHTADCSTYSDFVSRADWCPVPSDPHPHPPVSYPSCCKGCIDAGTYCRRDTQRNGCLCGG